MAAAQNITHLIVELNTGGAEMSLLRLLQTTHQQLRHRVICLGTPTGPGGIGERIRALGVPVIWLNYRRPAVLLPVLLLAAMWRVRKLLRADPPDVLQGWMYYGNLLASLLKPRRSRVAWNIRHSLTDWSNEKLQIRLAVQLARLSNLQPELLIYNSYAGRCSHAALGFKPLRECVIPNGIDTELFHPDPQRRQHTRQTLFAAEADVFDEVPEDVRWVAMVGRFHPHKGVQSFLQVVRAVLDSHAGQCRFCAVGAGMDVNNPSLRAMLRQAGLQPEELLLLGAQQDMPGVMNALDVLVLPSLQEGTPNVLLEAIACGVTTVATSVGDVPRILHDSARLVQPGDTAALITSLRRVLDHPVDTTPERQLVAQHYNAAACARAYLDSYVELQ